MNSEDIGMALNVQHVNRYPSIRKVRRNRTSSEGSGLVQHMYNMIYYFKKILGLC